MATKKAAKAKKTMAAAAKPAATATVSSSSPVCAAGVCAPQRTQGLRAPATQGTHSLVSIKGPGVFVAAAITKQGGATGLTFVSLDLDGRNVANLSYAAAQNWGLTESNPYGIVLLGAGDVRTLSIGWPTPLRFERELSLSVTINEGSVVQVLGNVVHGGA